MMLHSGKSGANAIAFAAVLLHPLTHEDRH